MGIKDLTVLEEAPPAASAAGVGGAKEAGGGHHCRPFVGAARSLARESKERFGRLQEAWRREKRDQNWRRTPDYRPPVYQSREQESADVAFLRAALFWARGRLPWHWGYAAGWRRVHAGYSVGTKPPPMPGAGEGCPPGLEWTDERNLAKSVLQDLGHESDAEDDYWQIRGSSEW